MERQSHLSEALPPVAIEDVRPGWLFRQVDARGFQREMRTVKVLLPVVTGLLSSPRERKVSCQAGPLLDLAEAILRGLPWLAVPTGLCCRSGKSRV